MEIIKFNVEFITPLLIHGINNNADANGLSSKALRGCWRFWCRALIGGVIKDIDKDKDKLSELESNIFGSADRKIGSKFRLKVEEWNGNNPMDIKLGFTYKKGWNKGNPAQSKGFKEGVSCSITIITRTTMTELEKNILLATIWLWGNLGAVGNRSRRGFGSPVIYIEDESKNPFSNLNGEKIELTIGKQPFADTEKLESHLINGLKNVWELYAQWINNHEGNIATLPAPKQAPYFILQSLEQIAVGEQGYINRDQAITEVHGMSGCKGLGFAFGNERLASPVFIRFHKVMNKDGLHEYLPIFTWCKQNNNKKHYNCAKKYLTDINVSGKAVFVNNLKDNPI